MNRSQVIQILGDKSENSCKIFGTIRIPLENLAQYVRKFAKNAEIVVYSTSYQDYASYEAAKLLKALGYTALYLYPGGVTEWNQKGLPTSGNCTDNALSEFHEPKFYEHPKGVELITAEQLNKRIDILL